MNERLKVEDRIAFVREQLKTPWSTVIFAILMILFFS